MTAEAGADDESSERSKVEGAKAARAVGAGPDADAVAAAESLRELLAATVLRLDASGATDESLAIVKLPRGIGPLKTSLRMEPVGRAWRLGVLLLSRDGSLFETGKITRSVEPGRPQSLSQSVEQRRADRMAASRGHFRVGEVVNYEFEPIAVDAESLRLGSGPLSLVGADVFVRWGPASTARRPIAAYLDDRIEVLHPE